MLPLVGMTVSAFIFNTSEFMPIGLLTDIAKSFSISESKAGMLITVYSWIVMLLSLPLILLVSKIDFRKLFMGTIALFGICQIMSVIAPTYGVLMASRIGVACTHAIFWSIASPVAIRLVNEEHRSFALSMVVTGTSIATIAGLPLGSLVYLLFCVTRWGWGFDNYLTEANTGKGLRLPRWFKPYFGVVLPLLIVFILVQGL